MRTYTSHARQQQNLLSPTDLWLMLLEINHSALAAPLRFAVDSQELVSQGNTYAAIGARIELPDDQDTQYPRAQIVIDNVGRSLMRILEDTHGMRGATVKLIQVYRSRPDIWEQEIEMDMRDITATQSTVSAQLSFDNVFDRPSVPLTYRPTTKPGLF